MTAIHVLAGIASPGGLLFECTVDGCGRRLVIDRERGALVVIDHGDPGAVHRGGMGPVALAPVAVRQS
ncbi:hypothetical protein GCM10009557_61810 [Virgisporangium ochraceum]|uniref:Uncharacterized protein n=1 Tax=Virgisporangium ochraceum TaxID=65505 RepID=A0A8J4EDQ9_9ACTN|nr:hypothetical protein [Virgisporangium ochraceum]GIJ70843.1 hypothetical protein Voc01_057600 [Virgisporangium ochraceum]